MTAVTDGKRHTTEHQGADCAGGVGRSKVEMVVRSSGVHACAEPRKEGNPQTTENVSYMRS